MLASVARDVALADADKKDRGYERTFRKGWSNRGFSAGFDAIFDRFC